jgi:DNA repair exonuclease SbcCD ATPase subunit
MGITELILGALSSLIAAIIYTLFRNVTKSLFPTKEDVRISYADKMAELTGSLNDASRNVDRILEEMSQVSNQRQEAIAELETQLQSLTEREKQLKERVNNLEKVPLPAIEYFVAEIQKGEKRSAWRDYILFGSGVVVSTVATILLKVFWGF